jgi:hypothetical protein
MQDEEEVNIQEEDNSEQPVVDETEEAVIETPSTTKKLENSKSSPHFKMQVTANLINQLLCRDPNPKLNNTRN